MTGIIISTPPTVELPPGSSGGGPTSLPPVTYQFAVTNAPNNWTGLQTYNNGSIRFAGSTSGFTALNATAIASGTLALPAQTGTLATLADIITGAGPPVAYLEQLGGGISASRAANTAAVVTLAASGVVKIILGPGVYNFNPIPSITQSYVTIEGAGQGITTLSWQTGTLLTFDGGLSRITGCAVKNCTISSPDASNTKTAILVIDGSGFTLENVGIFGVGTNSILTGGAGSIGLQTKGREFFRTRGAVTISADKPIVLSKNPNVWLSCDLCEFGDNLNLIGGSSFPVITVDPGVMISNMKISADLELGTHGFYWNDTANFNHVSAINAAGSGYTAGDTLTVSGGTGTATTIKVVSVNGSGAVTSAAVLAPSAYSVAPSMPVSVTGGTGTAATFTLVSVVSGNLTIEGRAEQGTSNASNNLYIAPFGRIDIVNITGFGFDGSRKGVFLKNTRNATLLGTSYVPAGATEAINADNSNESLLLLNARCTTGATASINMTPIYQSSIPTGYALPTTAFYGVSFSGMKFSSIEANALFLDGATSGATILQAAATASGTITLPAGTTDFSATGGTSRFVKQASVGAPLTVVQPTFADISGNATSLAVSAQMTSAWSFSSAATNIGPVAISSSSADFSTGCGILIVRENTFDGGVAMFICGGGGAILVAQTTAVWGTTGAAGTTTPAASKCSVSFSGTGYRIYNGSTAGARQFSATGLAVITTSN